MHQKTNRIWINISEVKYSTCNSSSKHRWNRINLMRHDTKHEQSKNDSHYFSQVPSHWRSYAFDDIYSNNLVSCVPIIGSKLFFVESRCGITVSEIDNINDDCNRWWWCRPCVQRLQLLEEEVKVGEHILYAPMPFGGACAIWSHSYGERSQIVKVLFFTFQQSYTHTSVYKR